RNPHSRSLYEKLPASCCSGPELPSPNSRSLQQGDGAGRVHLVGQPERLLEPRLGHASNRTSSARTTGGDVALTAIIRSCRWLCESRISGCLRRSSSTF